MMWGADITGNKFIIETIKIVMRDKVESIDVFINILLSKIGDR